MIMLYLNICRLHDLYIVYDNWQQM